MQTPRPEIRQADFRRPPYLEPSRAISAGGTAEVEASGAALMPNERNVVVYALPLQNEPLQSPILFGGSGGRGMLMIRNQHPAQAASVLRKTMRAKAKGSRASRAGQRRRRGGGGVESDLIGGLPRMRRSSRIDVSDPKVCFPISLSAVLPGGPPGARTPLSPSIACTATRKRTHYCPDKYPSNQAS
jgi:hypothetical protein